MGSIKIKYGITYSETPHEADKYDIITMSPYFEKGDYKFTFRAYRDNEEVLRAATEYIPCVKNALIEGVLVGLKFNIYSLSNTVGRLISPKNPKSR